MYAHIYKARQGKVKLILTTGASISEGVVSEMLLDSKTAAKAEAKRQNATPWNY